MKHLLILVIFAGLMGHSAPECLGQDSRPPESKQPLPESKKRNRGKRSGRMAPNPQQMMKLIFENDRNGDGEITRDEVSGRMKRFFERMDSNQDGILTKEEARTVLSATMQNPQRREKSTRGKQSRNRNQPAGLKVGEAAPNFTLKSLDGKTETELAALIVDKPVILFFGSYT
ncbi:MAG: hypothetical protein P8J33_14135 [Pirellulaceae bacterium]|nr:hypothetical protein [Pirellulaceae bacterium]